MLLSQENTAVTTTKPRSLLTKLSTLAVASGLALSLMMSLAGDTHALPKDTGLSSTDDCTYAGKTYSEGSVIVMDDGKSYKCHDGHWDKARAVPPGGGSGWQLPIYPSEAAPITYNT